MPSASEPCSDQRGFVGSVIIHDDVDVEVGGHLRVNLLEEVEEFSRPVALTAFADHNEVVPDRRTVWRL